MKYITLFSTLFFLYQIMNPYRVPQHMETDYMSNHNTYLEAIKGRVNTQDSEIAIKIVRGAVYVTPKAPMPVLSDLFIGAIQHTEGNYYDFYYSTDFIQTGYWVEYIEDIDAYDLFVTDNNRIAKYLGTFVYSDEDTYTLNLSL